MALDFLRNLEQHNDVFEKSVCYIYIYYEYDVTDGKNLNDQKAVYPGENFIFFLRIVIFDSFKLKIAFIIIY